MINDRTVPFNTRSQKSNSCGYARRHSSHFFPGRWRTRNGLSCEVNPVVTWFARCMAILSDNQPAGIFFPVIFLTQPPFLRFIVAIFVPRRKRYHAEIGFGYALPKLNGVFCSSMLFTSSSVKLRCTRPRRQLLCITAISHLKLKAMNASIATP